MELPKNLESMIRKHALQNAVQYGGKAAISAVIGKIIAENPALKPRMKEVTAMIAAVIKDVNSMGAEKQMEELTRLAPELLEKKKAEKRDLLPLKNAVNGAVITRMPPEPSKYTHIGHALSFLINYMYAKKYAGKCYLRFEDTNPELSKKEYADAIAEDIEYIGIHPDKVVHISNDMPALYDYAEKMIKQGYAYVCFCSQEKMRELRHEGFGCSDRQRDPKQNVEEWKNILLGKYRAAEAVLRFKGDMESPNHAMRDPVLFRISHTHHYLQGDKYFVWPMYDFANSVEDGAMGITHILRSNEFGTMRIELQDAIKTALKLPKQTVIQYGRFNVKDSITHGREIRQLMQEGTVQGWDDPRLVTIKALRRRGIQPETFWELALDMGLSPTETNFDWQLISSINRKVLDPKCSRYFYVENAHKIHVAEAHEQKVELKLHPDHAESKRLFTVKDSFYLAKKDFDEISKLKVGSIVRMMDCLNFRKTENGLVFDSKEYEKYRQNGSMIIHWLPAEDKNLVSVKVLMPDATYSTGLAESGVWNLNIGEIVQFARFGFCRLEWKSDKAREMSFIYCHS